MDIDEQFEGALHREALAHNPQLPELEPLAPEDLGLSINAAKVLIKQVHEAVAEDLKENLDQNRSLDLARIDGLLTTHYPKAKAGKIKSAQLVLRCLERRAKLIGIEPLPAPTPHHSQSVLIWLQAKMPSINAIVNTLPPELPPPAP
jgi:hypothetical protein